MMTMDQGILRVEECLGMIDIPLMRKTLEFIEAHPDLHDQDYWGRQTECGTVACMAGWAVHLAGGRLLFDSASGDSWACEMPCGRKRRTDWAAEELLGLDDDQANRMFWDAETIDDLWALAEEFTGGELKRPR